MKRVAQRDEVVVARQLADLVERGLDRAARLRQRRRPTQHLPASASDAAARAQQHEQVVQDVGGLVVDALVALLARGAGDLLGLLLTFSPMSPGRRAARRCRSPRAARAWRSASVRSSAGSASCGAGGSRSPVKKQVRSPVWHAGPAGSTSASSASPSQSSRSARTFWCCPTSRPCATARRASGSRGAARRSRACARAPPRWRRPASGPRPTRQSWMTTGTRPALVDSAISTARILRAGLRTACRACRASARPELGRAGTGRPSR